MFDYNTSYLCQNINTERSELFHYRCTAFSYLEGDPELAYFAVYDGHGGTGVANYLKDHLHEFILDQPEYKKGDMEEAVHKAFLKVGYLLKHDKINKKETWIA